MSTQTTRSNYRYSDFYTNLDVRLNNRSKGDLYVLEDADAVKTSIKNIVLTNPNERFFNPDFGAGIPRTLFENITPETEMVIQKLVVSTIRNYEPRVDVLEVYVTAVPDDNLYHISILFNLVNNPNRQSLNVILNRVR